MTGPSRKRVRELHSLAPSPAPTRLGVGFGPTHRRARFDSQKAEIRTRTGVDLVREDPSQNDDSSAPTTRIGRRRMMIPRVFIASSSEGLEVVDQTAVSPW